MSIAAPCLNVPECGVHSPHHFWSQMTLFSATPPRALHAPSARRYSTLQTIDFSFYNKNNQPPSCNACRATKASQHLACQENPLAGWLRALLFGLDFERRAPPTTTSDALHERDFFDDATENKTNMAKQSQTMKAKTTRVWTKRRQKRIRHIDCFGAGCLLLSMMRSSKTKDNFPA